MEAGARTRALLLFGSLLACVRPINGQGTTASLSGVVVDPGRAVIPGVAIELKNLATGAVRATTSDLEGRYSIFNLEPGSYDLKAEKPGFKTQLQSPLSLAVAETSTLDLAMTLGNLSQQIVVAAQGPLLETAEAGLSRIVRTQEIQSLPNIGRNFVDFVTLDTGVHPGRENIGGGAFKEPDAGVGVSAVPRLSFGGQSELNTMIQVDGADNVQTFTGLPRTTPSQEAAQEFRVLDSTYLAEYGRSLSGFVNIVTKSGSNDPHGSLYYFGINNAFGAIPMLAQAQTFTLRHNQFGATLGGPLKEDKDFLFVNYEGQRHQESNNFAQFLNPQVVADINRVVGQFPGFKAESLDQIRSVNYDQGLAKLDHLFSSGHRFSVRYSYTSADTGNFPGGGGRDSVMSSTARNVAVRDQALLADETSVISGHAVNEARLQWARRSLDYVPTVNEPALEVSNLLLLGKTYSDFDFYRETRLQASDNLLDQRGSHAVKVGADFNRLVDQSTWDLFFPARIIFPSLGALLNFGPASNSPANGPVVFWWPFLTGARSQPPYSTSWNAAVPSTWRDATRFHFPYNAYGFFGQDQWRVTPQIWLTYGLRWDFETYPSPFATETDFGNFQPRVGLAYAPTSSTVVRAGFGIFTDRLAGSVGQVFNVAQDISRGNLPGAMTLYPGVAPVPGAFYQGTITPAQGLGAPSTAALNLLEKGAVPQPECLNQVPPACTANLSANKDGAQHNPYAYHATFQVSHQASKNAVLSAAYVFVRAPNLLAITPNLNAPFSGMTEPDGTPVYASTRFYPALGDFFVSHNGGFSEYNGGTVEAQDRLGGILGVHGSYSYSKTISSVDSLSNLGDFPQTSLRLEKSLSRQDLRHRFVLGLMSSGPAGVRALKGAEFDALVTVQSGAPYTIYAGNDFNHDGNPLNDRPGYPPGSPGCAAGCPLGRNSYLGPWFGDTDLRLGWNFGLKEKLKLELSADVFNAFNRTNIKDLNTTCGGPDILQCPNAVPQQTPAGFTLPTLLLSPRDVFGAREIQFAAKLNF